MVLNCYCICKNAVLDKEPHIHESQYQNIVPAHCVAYPTNENDEQKKMMNEKDMGKNDDKKKKFCKICDKKLYNRMNVVKTKCNHMFCLECIIKYKEETNKSECPYCKKLIFCQ